MKLLLRICEESEVRVISEYFVSVLKGKSNSPPVDRTILVQKGGKIMLTSLALIFLVGLAMGAICQRLKLPRIIGMLITGIVLGPYVLDFLDSSILSISADLRKMALIIILLKAGLSLDLNDLKKVGRPAIMLSFVPASFEIIGYVLLAPWILGITHVEAAVMGAVLAAVSPAVVVPRMVNLMESKYGTEKAIPQMIMAGASCDDIFVIVLFTTFLSMAQGGNANVLDFVNVPVSIVLGILLGAVVGYGLYLFFETSYAHKHCVRNSTKVIIVLGVSFLLALLFRTCGVLLCIHYIFLRTDCIILKNIACS